MAQGLFPVRIHILHVSVVAAKFSEKFGLVQKSTVVLHICFDAGVFVKSLVGILLCAVD